MVPPVPGIKVNAEGIPDLQDLPLREGDPVYSAWGLYGADDQLGTLNRLTDARVAAAAKSEIQTGVRISLNWPLGAQPTSPFFDRIPLKHEIQDKHPRCVNDDIWTLNSQSSSQWDGLRHYAYQKERKFYNGVTMEDIHSVDKSTGERSTVNGIHVWAKQGIVGRGILVDYHAWRTEKAKTDASYANFDTFETNPISLSDLKACLEAQGTDIRVGDILIIRSGWMVAHATKSPQDLQAYQAVSPPHFTGVEQSDELLAWLWAHVAAVAGDHPTFEAWPCARADWSLHEVLLSGWGCPIGELFDLEALAAHCAAVKRWSFFVVSEPCNVIGGVASPPNILAIF